MLDSVKTLTESQISAVDNDSTVRSLDNSQDADYFVVWETVSNRLLTDPAFLSKALGAGDVQTMLREEGIDLSVGEAKIVENSLDKIRAFVADQCCVLRWKAEQAVGKSLVWSASTNNGIYW